MHQRVAHCATLTPSIIAVVSKLLDRAPYTAVMHNGHPGGKSEKVLTRFINGGRYWIRTSDLVDVNDAL